MYQVKNKSVQLFLIIICTTLFFCNFCKASEEVDDETPFTYEQGGVKGPGKWGDIKGEWKQCGQGKLQSPIDLVNERVKVFSGLGKLKMDYKPAPATVHNRGHDITVQWKAYAGSITINGTVYYLKQCHWHSPSEHTVNGTRYQSELHIVHLSSKGEIAVIAILYKYGRPDPFLSELFHHIKASEVNHEEIPVGIINPWVIKLVRHKYFRYIGSLTVPPCTEGVIWTIVKKVATVSKEQVRALRAAVHDGFEENARPLQDLDGRNIYLYNPINNKNPLN